MFKHAKILNKFNPLHYCVVSSIITSNNANINNLLLILTAPTSLESICTAILIASPDKVGKIIFMINVLLKVIKKVKLEEFNKNLELKVKPTAKK